MRHRCPSLWLGLLLAIGLVATLLAFPGIDAPRMAHLAGASDTVDLADSPIAVVMIAVPAGKPATAIKHPSASPPSPLDPHPLSVVASILSGRRLESRVSAARASIPLRC